MQKILGLDLGTNSIGWALLEEDSAESSKILGAGVRIFSEVTESKTKTLKNNKRRQKRGERRQRARRKMRRDTLVSYLLKNKFLPEETADKSSLEEWFSHMPNPYELRTKALDQALTKEELARVFLHLCQRRGFQSNRKAKKKDDDGKVKSEILELQESIDGSAYRTLGEYLYHQPTQRCRYTSRQMFEEEFRTICLSQQKYEPDLLDAATQGRLFQILFFQRPLRVQTHLIGKCSLEKNRKRCSKAHLDWQRFRIWQDLNHLTVKDPILRQNRILEQNEKEKLFAELDRKTHLTWKQARKVLGLHDGELFNLEESERKNLTGNETAGKMIKAIGKTFSALLPDQQDQLVTDLYTIEEEKPLVQRLKNHWKFSEAEISSLCEVELPDGYGNVSMKAVRKLLPHLQQGKPYANARQDAGYEIVTNYGKGTDWLGEVPELRNPVVSKALHELRKVINAIIRKFGKPEIIRVEMSRDLKQSEKQRKETQLFNNKREKENNRIRDVLKKDFQLSNPKREDIQKYILWEEAEYECPYTGKTIGREKLFSSEIQIEHILPYSRTLDNSLSNKTLCFATENQQVKGNRTPFEAYSGDTEKYQDILQRVKKLPVTKRRKFEQQTLDEEDFTERHLNDTRYISRAAKDYLLTLGCKVQIGNGRLTSILRKKWNLNQILNFHGDTVKKNRDDHRHHAIDACVVALTSPGLLQKVSQLSAKLEQIELNDPKFVIGEPWAGFHQELSKAIYQINVSHAPTRKIAGALHEDTAYGYIEEEKKFVYRKPVESLSVSELDRVRDKKIKELLKNRIEACNGDLKKAFTEPLFHLDGVTPIKTVRVNVHKLAKESVFSVSRNGKEYKHYKTGNNHHLEVFEDATGKWICEIISTIEAARRVRIRKTKLYNESSTKGNYLFSLIANDSVEIPDGEEKGIYRVQNITTTGGGMVILRRIEMSSTDSKVGSITKTINPLKKMNARKVTINPIGQIYPAND